MRQRIIILISVAALALVASSIALAATLTPTGTVAGTAGIGVNVPANPTFSDTLDGTDQTATYSPILGVVDARGSGAGWNLTIAATTFSDGASHTLAPGSITAVSSACKGGSTCTNATSTGYTYPLVLSGTATKFFSANANTGLGKVDVTPAFSVSIPGNAYAGTYTSTLTFASATGP